MTRFMSDPYLQWQGYRSRSRDDTWSLFKYTKFERGLKIETRWELSGRTEKVVTTHIHHKDWLNKVTLKPVILTFYISILVEELGLPVTMKFYT